MISREANAFKLIFFVSFVLLFSSPLISALTATIGNSQFILRLSPGEEVERYVLVRNVNHFPVTITLTVDGDLKNNIDLEEEEFILAPNEEKRAYFTLIAQDSGTTNSQINFNFSNEGQFVGLISNIIVISEVEEPKVAYIYRAKFRVDDNIVNTFEDMGLTVDLINEKNLPSSFSGYKLIFLGDENFLNHKRIPVNNFPTVIANYYNADDFGLTDREGVSQLGSTSPLSVLINGRMIQVYTQAFERNRIALPYYYLDKENKAPAVMQIAGTESTSSGTKFGDVIGYVNASSTLANGKRANANICFFGIIESDFWTPAAKNLFKECVGFVSAQCFKDTDCPAPETSANFCKSGNVYKNVTSYSCSLPGSPLSSCAPSTSEMIVETCFNGCSNGSCVPGIHDVALIELPNSVGNIRIEDANNTDIISNTLQCNQDYKIGIKVLNKGNFSENITYEGSVDSLLFAHVSTNNLAPQDSSTKTRTVNFTLSEGFYNISVRAIIQNDAFPTDNTVRREIFISCPAPVIACSTNSQCGNDSFVGAEFCTEKNVTRNFITFICNNQGQTNSFCSNSTSVRTITQCSQLCSNGDCIPVACDSNDDCSDSNPLTFDECINPGTPIAQCRNTEINCASNLDCGTSGFIGNEFCTDKNISKNFITYTCNSPGTLNSSCFSSVAPQTVAQCQFSCSAGQCIRCSTNADCNDNNSSTIDLCNLPGTIQSYCTNIINITQPIIPCSSNNDCNDNMNNTEDICNLPGTPDSFCTNNNITCFTNSDCGINGFINNPFCTANNVTQDFRTFVCNNPGTSNSSCSSSVAPKTKQMCPQQCSNGQCASVECNTNSDCNDSNPLTFDECINPGTPASDCRNTQINCASNSDCGTSGLIGQEFCSANNVVKNLITYTCNNPGTLQSSCTSSTSPQQILSCQYSCSNGQCIRCSTNSQCNDNNSSTIDLCNEPGFVSSFCTNLEDINQPVACFTNSDCGNTTVISQNFCSVLDVKRLVRTFTCNSPGQSTAFCSSQVQQEQVQQCAEFCSSGLCLNIECSNNSECNDNNSSTFDLCNNPGLPTSFCTNNPLPITCSSNSDCGIDGFIGAPFCSASNVTQNFVTYTCNLPGTPQSSCSSSTSPKSKQSCVNGCSNGMCLSQLCGNGILESPEQCDDGNLINGDGCSSLCLITTQCSDGVDNDNDGKIDLADPDCDSSDDDKESPGARLLCVSKSACNNNEVELMAFSSETNAHAYLPGSDHIIQYHICCSATGAQLSSSCSAQNSAEVVKLSSEFNAHVEQSNLNNYPVNVCLSSNTNVSCSYRTHCLPKESCLFSMSGETNSHVGVCGAYPKEVCCLLS